MFGIDPLILLVGLMPLVAMGISGYAVLSLYKKCGPNQALIITGMYTGLENQPFKLITSGGAVVLPMIQQLHILSLEALPIKARMSSPIITRDKKAITVDCVGQIKIKNDSASIALAAENFLGKTGEEIKDFAEGIIGGYTNSVLSTLTVEEIAESLGKSGKQIQELSSVDLSKVGLSLITLSMKDIKDNASGSLYPF